MSSATSQGNKNGANNGQQQDHIAERLAAEIRSDEALHTGLLRDLAKLAASPSVDEEDFHATFLKALGKSGEMRKLLKAVCIFAFINLEEEVFYGPAWIVLNICGKRSERPLVGCT